MKQVLLEAARTALPYGSISKQKLPKFYRAFVKEVKARLLAGDTLLMKDLGSMKIKQYHNGATVKFSKFDKFKQELKELNFEKDTTDISED